MCRSVNLRRLACAAAAFVAAATDSMAADRDLMALLAGKTVGAGTFADRFEKTSGTVKLAQTGTPSPTGLTLKRHYDISDGSRDDFTWRFTALGNGRYKARREDLDDDCIVQWVGDRFVMTYTAPVTSTSKVTANLEIEESFVVLDDNTLRNLVKLRYFGIDVGESDVTITRQKQRHGE